MVIIGPDDESLVMVHGVFHPRTSPCFAGKDSKGTWLQAHATLKACLTWLWGPLNITVAGLAHTSFLQMALLYILQAGFFSLCLAQCP